MQAVTAVIQVLLSHCYFNIYNRVTQGWESYLARRKTSE